MKKNNKHQGLRVISRLSLLSSYLLATFSLLFTSCEKDLMDYEGLEGVYFAVQWGASYGGDRTWPYMPYSDVNLMNYKGDTVSIGLKVMVTGAIKDYDRQYRLEVVPDSTTGKESIDYVSIPTGGTIKAGQLADTLYIKLLRTAKLDNEQLRLGIQLVPTDQLALSFPSFDAVAGFSAGTVIPNFDASKHTIRYTAMLSRPNIWVGTDASPYNGGYESGSWGAFSKKKLELICERFDLTYADFASNQTMPTVLQGLITKAMSKMLIERYNAKNPILEDDGRLMWFGYCPWQSKIGLPWVPEEGYYD